MNYYRILIEDENGLHQAILKDTDEAQDVVKNLKMLLKTSELTDYIFIADCKNYNGADISVHGNGEKVAQMFDLLTRFMIAKDPGVMLRLMAAWENGKGAGAKHD